MKRVASTSRSPSGNWGMGWGKKKVPRIVIGPNAVVEGTLVFEREVKLYVHAERPRRQRSPAPPQQRYDGATTPRPSD